MRCWVHWQKLTEQVFQYLGISGRFDEPNPCISSFWEKHENHKWWHLLFVTSNTLQEASSSTSLQRCMLDCMYPLHQNHLCTDLPRFWHRVSKTLESSVMRVIKVSLVMLMMAFGSNRKMKAGCQWNQSRHQKVETFSPTSAPIHSRRGEGLKTEFSHQELMI